MEEVAAIIIIAIICLTIVYFRKKSHDEYKLKDKRIGEIVQKQTEDKKNER